MRCHLQFLVTRARFFRRCAKTLSQMFTPIGAQSEKRLWQSSADLGVYDIRRLEASSRQESPNLLLHHQDTRQPHKALTRFSISKRFLEEIIHFFLSRAGELNFHFSICRKNSHSPLKIRDFNEYFFLMSRFKILIKNFTFPLDRWDSTINSHEKWVQ